LENATVTTAETSQVYLGLSDRTLPQPIAGGIFGGLAVICGTAIAVRTENTESRIRQQLYLTLLIFKKASRPLSCSEVSYTEIVDLHPPN
jgi:hypothetical protein